MFSIYRTETFNAWLTNIKDRRAAARIASRLLRAESGNLGDVKSVGGGISEMRIDYGRGYRVYFLRRGSLVIILLCGGDKSTQQADIAKAKKMAMDLKESDK